METQPAPVLEFCVFEVRDPSDFPVVQRRTHEALARLSGYRASLPLRGTTHGRFADLVAWEAIEAAQQASKVVREDPRFVALMHSIAELKLYAHYRLSHDTETLLAGLRRAPIVELAGYGVNDVAAHLTVHPKLHEALRTVTGHVAGAHGQQVEDARQFADVVGWEDVAAHKRAEEAMQERGELASFFSGIAEMKVFELFSIVG